MLGWMRRHGALDLLLLLPDGSRSLIPAGWTDLAPGPSTEAPAPATLGTLADLLQAGRVVAGLRRSLPTRAG